MTVHHDKPAYGRLASGRKDLSDEDVAKMLEKLSGEDNGRDREKERSAENKESPSRKKE